MVNWLQENQIKTEILKIKTLLIKIVTTKRLNQTEFSQQKNQHFPHSDNRNSRDYTASLEKSIDEMLYKATNYQQQS